MQRHGGELPLQPGTVFFACLPVNHNFRRYLPRLPLHAAFLLVPDWHLVRRGVRQGVVVPTRSAGSRLCCFIGRGEIWFVHRIKHMPSTYLRKVHGASRGCSAVSSVFWTADTPGYSWTSKDTFLDILGCQSRDRPHVHNCISTSLFSFKLI